MLIRSMDRYDQFDIRHMAVSSGTRLYLPRAKIEIHHGAVGDFRV